MKLASNLLKKNLKYGFNSLNGIAYRSFATSTAESKDNPVLRGMKLQAEAENHAEKLEFYDALEKSVEAAELTERAFGPTHAYTGEALMKTADYYDILGYFEKAMSDAKQAVDILQEHKETHRPVYSTALSTYSKTLASGGLYKEALQIENESYQIRNDTFGPHNIQTVRSLCALGDRYRLVGDMQNATKILNDCYEKSDQYFDNKDIEKYLLHLSLAELYVDKKDYNLAHYHIDRILWSLKILNLKTHPLLGKIYNTLGELELFDKDHQGAYDALQTSLKFYETVFEGHHPDCAMAMTLLARYYLEKGDPNRAKKIQEDALEMFKNFTADITHPQYSIMSLSLGFIKRQTTDKKGAQKLTEDSYNDLVTKLGADHPKSKYYAYAIENYTQEPM